jgi:hypothetical protein
LDLKRYRKILVCEQMFVLTDNAEAGIFVPVGRHAEIAGSILCFGQGAGAGILRGFVAAVAGTGGRGNAGAAGILPGFHAEAGIAAHILGEDEVAAFQLPLCGGCEVADGSARQVQAVAGFLFHNQVSVLSKRENFWLSDRVLLPGPGVEMLCYCGCEKIS